MKNRVLAQAPHNLTPIVFVLTGWLVWSMSVVGAVGTGDLTKDPADIVKAYTRLDSQGVRLDVRSQEVLYPYTTWTQEPAWGKVLVIEGYEVLDNIRHWDVLGKLEARIPVEYHVVGDMYWETATFVPNHHVERIWVHVKDVGHRWRIVGPNFPPHVGRRRMINYVRQAILDEPDSDNRADLLMLRDMLRKDPS